MTVHMVVENRGPLPISVAGSVAYDASGERVASEVHFGVDYRSLREIYAPRGRRLVGRKIRQARRALKRRPPEVSFVETEVPA